MWVHALRGREEKERAGRGRVVVRNSGESGDRGSRDYEIFFCFYMLTVLSIMVKSQQRWIQLSVYYWEHDKTSSCVFHLERNPLIALTAEIILNWLIAVWVYSLLPSQYCRTKIWYSWESGCTGGLWRGKARLRKIFRLSGNQGQEGRR